VPLLQIWLYATREGGSFEKRYRDLCQILNICHYKHLSKVKEKLGPSLEELQQHRYLACWQIRETSDGTDFKIIFYHGEKFSRDQLTRIQQTVKLSTHTIDKTQPNSVVPDPARNVKQDLLHELMKRGISERASVDLLRHLRPDQQVMDQLEWGDHLLRNAPRGKFYNPAGILITLIKENVIPPETFESSRKRKLREAAEHARDQQRRELARTELAYIQYKDQHLASFIKKHWSVEELADMVEAKKGELLQQDRWKRLLSFNQDTLDQAANRQVRAEIATTVSFPTFSEFKEKLQPNSSGYLVQSPSDFCVPALLKT